MKSRSDFWSMPAMDRRGFLAGLLACGAASAIPGVERVEAIEPSQAPVAFIIGENFLKEFERRVLIEYKGKTSWHS